MMAGDDTGMITDVWRPRPKHTQVVPTKVDLVVSVLATTVPDLGSLARRGGAGLRGLADVGADCPYVRVPCLVAPLSSADQRSPTRTKQADVGVGMVCACRPESSVPSSVVPELPASSDIIRQAKRPMNNVCVFLLLL